MNSRGYRPTGRVFLRRAPLYEGKRTHLQAKPGQTRCGQMGNFRMVATEADGVNCRMCLRCIDTDNGLRYTR